MTPDERWFGERTAGAPEQLRVAATSWWTRSTESSRGDRLTGAGQRALDAAIAGGASRGAALDLLAADALITLALLAAAEANPTTLAERAVQYRATVTPA